MQEYSKNMDLSKSETI